MPESSSKEQICSVVVPASTANVGCAFDCAAIALNLYLRISVKRSKAGIEVSYRGEGAGEIPLDETNLVVAAMQAAAKFKGAALPPFRLDLQNEIPLGVGLGSSAAAIIGGILLGGALCGKQFTPSEALRMAVEIEGHPDNVAAALYGGFVVAGAVGEGPDVMFAKANIPRGLEFVAVIPDIPLPTEKARAALPSEYARQVVVGNLQRTALLAARLFSGGKLSPELFVDALHQPYRAPLVPGIAECLAYRDPDLAGVFLSGAGSAVMAIARHSADNIGQALVAEFRRMGTNARAVLLRADNQGAQLRIARGRRSHVRLRAEKRKARG